MENRYKTMNEASSISALRWNDRKDLSICLAEARRNGASLPSPLWSTRSIPRVEKMGGKRWDTSSLLARANADLQSLTGRQPAFRALPDSLNRFVFRRGRVVPGHPRLLVASVKTWMPGAADNFFAVCARQTATAGHHDFRR